MHTAGNRRGGLPFTVVLRNGRIFTFHEGGLTEADLVVIRRAGNAN